MLLPQRKSDHGIRVGVVYLLATIGVVWGISSVPVYAVYEATTTVSLTVCGDAIVSGLEVCDDGTNTGAYANSIAGRRCQPFCRAWGPYCGDAIIQFNSGEGCDDGNNTAGDLCNPSCQNEQPPVVQGGSTGGSSSGGGGGRSSGGTQGIPGAGTEGKIDFTGTTQVLIRGTAYPGATVTILRDGTLERVVEADGSANFEYTLSGETPGITTLGFWALDRAQRKSITYSATFQIVQNAVTTLTGILIPPTLAVDPTKVAPGGTVSFAGSAAPKTQVQAYVDKNEKPEVTTASGNGEWTIAYDTRDLAAETFHTVKANYIDLTNVQLKSGYSQIVSYYVGVNDVNTNLTADLNHDGSVNLTDFSILLFHWNSSDAVADINKDGTVSLPDFSIMLFYWTG